MRIRSISKRRALTGAKRPRGEGDDGEVHRVHAGVHRQWLQDRADDDDGRDRVEKAADDEEHGGEDGAFSELDSVNKANVAARLKEIKGDKDAVAEATVLSEWISLNDKESDCKRRLRDAEVEVDAKAYSHYPTLSEAEIKTLVVEDKWLGTLDSAIRGEIDRVSAALSNRVNELAERYESPIPKITSRVAVLEATVNRQLNRMGFSWN